MSRAGQTSTVDATRGRWGWILSSFGIDQNLLDGYHHECPACGGEDRFRFDNKDGRGTFYCNGCGAGDGFDLLRRMNGWSFQEAANAVDRLMGKETPPEANEKEVSVPKRSIERIRALLIKAWSKRNNKQLVYKYLLDRGLNLFDGDEDVYAFPHLHGCDNFPYWLKGKKVGEFPTMLALVTAATGDPVSIHRTYLMPDGAREKKLMTPLDNLSGSYISLVDPDDEQFMVYGEGIETTLAGWLFCRNVYGCDPGARAAISAGNLSKQNIPNTVKHVVICVDQDSSFTGQAHAFELARRVKVMPKRSVGVSLFVPRRFDDDVLDTLARGDEPELWEA